MINKVRLVQVLMFLLSLSLVGCSSMRKSSNNKRKMIKETAGQCILDYKVTYEHKTVPDWYNRPDGFCVGNEKHPIPIAIGIFPLKYVGKMDQKNNITLDHDDSWFYVTWGCYGPCFELKDREE